MSAPLREAPVAHPGQGRSFVWQVVAVVIALALLAVGILVGTHVIVLGNTADMTTPQATVSGYFSALKNQDYQRAYSYVSNQFIAAESNSQFTTAQKNDQSTLGSVTAYTITSIAATGTDKDEAKVTVTRDAKPLTYTVELSTTDNKWQIDSVTS